MDTRGRITRDGIRIHEDADFAGMHKAGRLAAEILDRIPSAQRALFQRYHVGGCSSCAFQPTDTLAQVCKDHNILDVNEVVSGRYTLEITTQNGVVHVPLVVVK